jgi:uncharacterized protein YggE
MSRGILTTVGVALLLLTAGCAGSFAPGDANAATQGQQSEQDGVQGQQFDRGGSSIQVAATGAAETTPDAAVVRVAAVAQADDADAVREQLARNASGVRDALADLGLADDQIRTVAYNIDQQYRERGGERVPDGIEGIHAFEITLSNVSQAAIVVDAAVENGADRVDSVELTLSEELRREVRAEALRDAMANARANADVIAESADLSIAGVHSATTGDLSFSPDRAEQLEADTADGTRTEIESGPLTVSAQVRVTYNATDASGETGDAEDGAADDGTVTTDGQT